jgi:hypothetical protein
MLQSNKKRGDSTTQAATGPQILLDKDFRKHTIEVSILIDSK